MKLAEALLLRADLQKKLASLQARVTKYAIVQEGEQPAEDPADLLRQIESISGQLRDLIFGINKTNLAHTLRTGQTITEALATRDVLIQRHAILNAVIDACTRPPDRYGVAEIRWVTTVKPAALQQQADDLARQVRELNAAIQEAGWQVELV